MSNERVQGTESSPHQLHRYRSAALHWHGTAGELAERGRHCDGSRGGVSAEEAARKGRELT